MRQKYMKCVRNTRRICKSVRNQKCAKSDCARIGLSILLIHSTKYTNLQPENKRNSFAEICIFCGIPKYILTEYMIDTSSGTLSIENYIGTFT